MKHVIQTDKSILLHVHENYTPSKHFQ